MLPVNITGFHDRECPKYLAVFDCMDTLRVIVETLLLFTVFLRIVSCRVSDILLRIPTPVWKPVYNWVSWQKELRYDRAQFKDYERSGTNAKGFGLDERISRGVQSRFGV